MMRSRYPDGGHFQGKNFVFDRCGVTRCCVGSCGPHSLDRFLSTGAGGDNGVANMWYSFDYGPIHFVSLNTETDFAGATEEHKGDSGAWTLQCDKDGKLSGALTCTGTWIRDPYAFFLKTSLVVVNCLNKSSNFERCGLNCC